MGTPRDRFAHVDGFVDNPLFAAVKNGNDGRKPAPRQAAVRGRNRDDSVET